MKLSQQSLIPLVITISFLAAASVSSNESPLRIIRGKVLDKHDAPLPTAVIYLGNYRINNIRTCASDTQGRCPFAGLIPFDDYEIHVEHHDWISKARTVSHLDSKSEVEIDQRADKKR